jgi:Geranylgeranyl pyrophosphate synthase
MNLSATFENSLEAYLSNPLSTTFEAAKYALFSGGKRVRPLLFLSALESFQHPLCLPPALSLEFIHTYSLIHDDLPSMDNDDFRRGKPTVHKVFPEGIAILAGDFLLTKAFELLAESECADCHKVTMIQVLGKASGLLGMIGGQTMDLELEGKECSVDLLRQMHLLKTGALMGASLEFAAILMEKERSLFRQLGERLGVAFQIKNDLNDERGSDAKNKKATYAALPNPLDFLKQEEEAIESLLIELHLKSTPLESLFKTVLA